MHERDVTARVNYYICAGSEHLFGFLLKCNKNYMILKKMPSAAQWNILHHPSTYVTKITAIQNFGHLCLGALYLYRSCCIQREIILNIAQQVQHVITSQTVHARTLGSLSTDVEGLFLTATHPAALLPRTCSTTDRPCPVATTGC